MFANVNEEVGNIAGMVGQTPFDYNSEIYSMIRNLSETVIIPIAGIILTFVLCYELIQMILEKNNMADDVFCKGGISNARKSNTETAVNHLWLRIYPVHRGDVGLCKLNTHKLGII